MGKAVKHSAVCLPKDGCRVKVLAVKEFDTYDPDVSTKVHEWLTEVVREHNEPDTRD